MHKRLDLITSFPYQSPRGIQAKALETLSLNWQDYDVFVMSAPTAFGKTAVAKTLMNAFRSVSAITPTNLLVDQFRSEFGDTPTLARLDSYYCEEWKRPCPGTRAKLMQFCKGCECGRDLSTAKYRKGPGIYNYHAYLAHKLYRDVLVVDEAHNLIPFIRERMGLLIWKHDYGYPVSGHEQLKAWFRSLPSNKKKHKKIQVLEEALFSAAPRYVVEFAHEEFNGKGTLRGQPESRPCLKLLPIDISDAPPILWPREVQKLVLLSATIGPKDIEALGLGRKRVLFVNCESPIPSAQRPIVIDPVVSINYHNIVESASTVAQYIDGTVAPYHTGQKGVIHATYQMASELAKHLTGPRYLFHNRLNKREQYELFRKSAPEAGRILVACGMYEGIDLPQDLGRWQVISKIPWMSLTNPAVRHLSEQDQDWYHWEVWKIVMQACGRICRTPEDFGVTYIPDASFGRLWDQAQGMTPQWFRDGLIF